MCGIFTYSFFLFFKYKKYLYICYTIKQNNMTHLEFQLVFVCIAAFFFGLYLGIDTNKKVKW
jgi:hypothetical protein